MFSEFSYSNVPTSVAISSPSVNGVDKPSEEGTTISQMKLIPLTGIHGVGKFAIVDDADFELLNQWKWHASKNKKVIYVRRGGYWGGKSRAIMMHRFILGLHKEKYPLVDHIDRNPLNNRRSNLRLCSNSENCKNRSGHGLSAYRGVQKRRQIYYTKGGEKREYFRWCATVYVGGKNKQVGSFKTEIEAAIAYNKAALKYHGEFASQNKINND